MKCHKCQEENPASAKFCLSCGASLAAAPAPAAPAIDEEFELQPEAPKRPDEQMPPGLAPRLDLDAEPEDGKFKTTGPAKEEKEKKPKKPAPDKPKDYKKESQIMIGVSAGVLLVSFMLCLHAWLGFPCMVGIVFGFLAWLEATKVDEFYKQEDYPSADKAAADARKWIKIGIIAVIATFVLSSIVQLGLIVLKLMGIFTPKEPV